MQSEENLMLTMADVTGVLFERQIASYIEKQAEELRVARQLVNINRDLQKPGSGNEILVPKRNKVDATIVVEGASLTLQSPSYDSVTIQVQILGAAVEIGDETLEASQFNLINDQLENLALALAQKEDLDIIQELCDYTPIATIPTFTGDGSETSFDLTNSNVIEIVEIIADGTTLTTSYLCNFKDGTVQLSMTVSNGGLITIDYAYSNSLTCYEPSTAGIMNYEAILHARNTIIANKFKPNILLIHPDQEYDLLQLSMFIDASEYGDKAPVQDGNIGKIAGLQVYVTQNCPKGVAMIFDSKRAVTYAIKKDVYTKMTREGSYAVKGTVAIMAKMWAKAGRINDDAIVLVTNAQDLALIA